MKKKDIVGAALKDLLAREESLAAVSVDVRAYKRQVIATLEKKLAGVQPNLDIPTCDDFAHLGVECCSVCHIDYPEWELDLVKSSSEDKHGCAAHSIVLSIRPSERQWNRVQSGGSLSACSSEMAKADTNDSISPKPSSAVTHSYLTGTC